METPNFVDSKFRLAILASKRAKQLVNGAKKKIDVHAENPLTVALEEIKLGLINFHVFSQEELALGQTDVEFQELDGENLSGENDEIVLDDESDIDTLMEDSGDDDDLLVTESE